MAARSSRAGDDYQDIRDCYRLLGHLGLVLTARPSGACGDCWFIWVVGSSEAGGDC